MKYGSELKSRVEDIMRNRINMSDSWTEETWQTESERGSHGLCKMREVLVREGRPVIIRFYIVKQS